MRKKYLAAFIGLVLAAHHTSSWSMDLNYEPPPPTSSIQILCVTCGDLFDTDTHKVVLDNLVEAPFNRQLRKALYWQDMTAFQFQSKAHFDNCDFDGALGYIQELISEVDALVGTNAKTPPSDQKQAILDSFFKLGQALHAIQDFYAHTNYLELQGEKVSELLDVEKIEVWTPEGAAKVRAMAATKDLISGYVWWGYPQMCPEGTESHADLAKDSPKGKGGTDSGFNGYTYHRAASELARLSSVRFFSFAFKRWPALKDANIKHVAFEVMEDHRQHEDAKKL